MKYIYITLIVVSSYYLNAQYCAVTMTINVTPPTCSTCCDGSATVTGVSCGVYAYTWAPGGTSPANYNMCGGITYTVYADLQSTVCCGASTGTTTIYVPKPGSTSITEQNELNNIQISPIPNNGKISITHEKYFSDIELNLYDITGKTILIDKLIGIRKDLELNIENGIYFIKFINNETGQIIVKKIIIQR